ncbi:MAG: hypothetical protein ACE5E4_10765 [Candidatus Binatia bacterium]
MTRIRVLVEFFLDEAERELERAQVGIAFGPTAAWIGRFHNPLGYWNTTYHHGTFLQPTIARPDIIQFEGDGECYPFT